MEPELVMVPPEKLATPTLPPPVLDIVMMPPELLVMVPPEKLEMPKLPPPVLVNVMEPELVIVPEFVISVDIVTVIPLGIILSSAASGTDPPIQVAPVFQSPLAAAVTVAA